MPKDISCGLWPSITILPLRFLGSFALPADAAYKPLTYCVVGLESAWQSVSPLICQLKGEVIANTKRAAGALEGTLASVLDKEGVAAVWQQ